MLKHHSTSTMGAPASSNSITFYNYQSNKEKIE